MVISTNEIILPIVASLLSGLVASLINQKKNKRANIERLEEKARDDMRIELKDLQIKLYKLEKDLDEWKDKYYDALQELIKVRSDLEESLVKLSHLELHEE
jgi:septal ring factor EnvC (AmiA/AmiB activator)